MKIGTICKQYKKKSGIIIPYLLVFAGILALVLASVLGYISYRYEQSVRQTARSNALQVAEAGLNYYYWYVIHTLEGKSCSQLTAYWNGTPLGVPRYTAQIKNQSGAVIGGYQIEVTPPTNCSTIIMAKITGWDNKYPSLERSIQARLRKPSWSEYAVVANDIMRFGAGTETWGPIFSNNGIHFDGVAHNLVSSNIPTTYFNPDYGVNKPGVWTALSNESQVFLAGKLFPADYVDFNKLGVDFGGVMKPASQPSQGGLYLGPLGSSYCGYHLVLRADNKVNVTKVRTCGTTTFQISRERSLVTYNLPSNGLIFVEDDAWVDGVIKNKRLTIVSADTLGGTMTNIYLNHNINYTYYDGRDALGLIAQNNVSVGLYSDDVLNIDAALVAETGRVGRDYYTSSDSSTYYKRSTIRVNGAIATNRRYGFAWICGSTHCSGYNTRNLIYDNNLYYTPPPFFPTGDHYSYDLWEEN
jgi:hypothetical protein